MSETYIPAALRRLVIERASGCCEYCRLSSEVSALDFVIDHIIAEKHGGKTIEGNLCLSCFSCNSFKGSDINYVDWAGGGQIVPLFHPRKQPWADHFVVNDARIMPLTPTGRVTEYLLRLNSDERVEERQILIALSAYPCVGAE